MYLDSVIYYNIFLYKLQSDFCPKQPRFRQPAGRKRQNCQSFYRTQTKGAADRLPL